MRKLLLALLAVLSTATLTEAAPAADTVYVIRHLQKAEGADPPLSAEGAANAQLLAARLRTSGIKAIFATRTQRAMQTGEPLAKQLGIAVTGYDPRDPDALIKAVAAINGAALIVGHSNTVPDIVARLGGAAIAPLGDQDYGTIFVARPGSSAVEQIVLKASPERG
jgi:phosphohistidine phosphatase SixA